MGRIRTWWDRLRGQPEQEPGPPPAAHDELELGQKRAVREEEERLAREAEQPNDRA
jgi:hypothetical protein